MSLTTGEYYILEMSYRYLVEKGKRAISYDGLINYIYYKHKKVYKVETIQKYMRNLASAGFFERIYVPSYQHPGAKTVLYIPTDEFWKFFGNKRR